MEKSNILYKVAVSMRVDKNPISRRGNLVVTEESVLFSDQWRFGSNLIVTKIQSAKGAVEITFDSIATVDVDKYMLTFDELRIRTRNGKTYKFVKDGIGKGSIAEAADTIRTHCKQPS